jgi:SEC-C motif domain protein
MTCPCGSGVAEGSCCGPIIAGALAATALALMRSRYTAYVRGALDHVVATHAAETRDRIDREAATRWSHDTTWLGLQILATSAGRVGDDAGVVELVARGSTAGAAFSHHERSRFRRDGGRWYYVDGDLVAEPARGAAARGRNEPCPCGSGQKYKRCHGA